MALDYPTMGQLKSLLFPPKTPCPLPNLAVLTKAEEQHMFPGQRQAMHPFQHLLHLLMAIQARLACSDQSDTKAYVLGSKHSPLPLPNTTAGLLHRLWEAMQYQSLASICPGLGSTTLHSVWHSNPDPKG